MENDIEKIFKDSAGISLSASEKDRTRRFLASYVEAMPVRDASPARQEYRGVFAALLFTKKFMPVFSVLLAASLALGGVSFAAEGALPGDALYPVKVGVNEEVRAALAVSSRAKADWEARRAERRLEEAEDLAAKSRLHAGVRADIEQRLTVHAGRVNERINGFEDREDFEAAAEVSSRLEGSLAAHRKILSRLGVEVESGIRAELAALAATLDGETALASETRVKTEGSVSGAKSARVRAAAEAKMTAAGRFIAATREILSAESRLGTEAAADARARLDAADAAFAEGQARLKAGLYPEAFILFQEAHRAAGEARVTVKVEGRASAEAGRRRKDGSRKEDEDDRDEDDHRDKKTEVNINAGAEVKLNEHIRGEASTKLDLDL